VGVGLKYTEGFLAPVTMIGSVADMVGQIGFLG